MLRSQITPRDIASAMSITEGELWKIARNCEQYFKPRRMQPVRRKHRPIDPMHPIGKQLFRRLHRWLQRQRLHHPRAYGAVWRRSIFKNAERHLGRRYVWTRDARNCYPSISSAAMYKELKLLGFRHDTSRLLSQLFTVRGHIPQGSPLSGDALNLFFWRMDQTIASFCGHSRLSFGRVADDFVLSGDDRGAGENGTKLIARLLDDRGIEVNQSKLRKDGFQDQSREQTVHGIAVNSRRGTKINKLHHNKAIKLAEAYLAACKSVQPSSLEALAHKHDVIHGWMHHCRQAHSSPAKHVRQLFEAGNRVVQKKLRSLGISAYKGKWWLVSNGKRHKRNEPRRIAAIWRTKLAAPASKSPPAPICTAAMTKTRQPVLL